MESPFRIRVSDTALFEDFIRKAPKIGIVTHMHPDGDAIGSSLAMKHFIEDRLDSAGRCRILLDTEAPDAVRFLFSPTDREETFVWGAQSREAEDWIAGCDLLIILDLNRFSRTGKLEPALRNSGAKKVLVDHHLDPDAAGFDLVFSRTEVSSTCELLCHVLSLFPVSDGKGLPASCLDPLLTGITTDTNNFANSVFGTTLKTVSALLDAGADREAILEHLYNSYPERRIRLMGRLLDSELTVTGRGVAYMVLDRTTADAFGILDGETEGFVNIPLAIDRVKMSLFLKQEGDEYRVSIRSKRGWSANRLATRYFEGGGHEQASGGKIRLGGALKTKADVAALIERCTDEFLENEA